MKNKHAILAACALALFTVAARAQTPSLVVPQVQRLAPVVVTSDYFDPTTGLPLREAQLDVVATVGVIRAANQLSWPTVANRYWGSSAEAAARYSSAARATLTQAANQLSWPLVRLVPAAAWCNYFLSALSAEESAAASAVTEIEQAEHEGYVVALTYVVGVLLDHGASWSPATKWVEPTVGCGVPCSRAISLLEAGESAVRTGVTQCPFAATDAWKAWLNGAAQIYRDLQGQVLAVLYGQSATVAPLARLLEQLAEAKYKGARLPTEVERARSAGRALALQAVIEVIYGQVFIPEPSNSEPERSSDPLLPQLAKPEIQPGVISLN